MPNFALFSGLLMSRLVLIGVVPRFLNRTHGMFSIRALKARENVGVIVILFSAYNT